MADGDLEIANKNNEQNEMTENENPDQTVDQEENQEENPKHEIVFERQNENDDENENEGPLFENYDEDNEEEPEEPREEVESETQLRRSSRDRKPNEPTYVPSFENKSYQHLITSLQKTWKNTQRKKPKWEQK